MRRLMRTYRTRGSAQEIPGSREGRGVRSRTHYGLQDFHYDEEKDQYVCPNGKELSLKVKELIGVPVHSIEYIVHRNRTAEVAR